MPRHHHAPLLSSSFKYGPQPSFNYTSEAPQPRRTLDRRYSKTANNNRSSDEHVVPSTKPLLHASASMCSIALAFLNYGSQPSFNGSEVLQLWRTLDRRYSKIADNYQSLHEVSVALAHAGLESSNLIVGIDFTKSNEWTGARSFNR
ncbi:hypothetical protein CIPAW_05G168100 [Carya illinoinensis]|uniref:Copine C-terminal domain-containing protein n=1 Tax=Carya illinoinensis TaxID=32201 RepID=A0A8T1QKB0_CARIL|nr:hypothetical protein CIPAW_05G168100 [Carya illinoinensis]KAG6654762.1 hypothetical protein CIPAW_05G168100 [Carya illinoinensis]KAG6654763.1 hypothetical protein CIPAW_05G168100 [Carya illinoinensis]